MPSYSQVKKRCVEGRYFKYVRWRKFIFLEPSFFLTWIFVNLGWSGNAVGALSGVVTIIGGIMLASQDSLVVFIGSFAYLLFYLLDYVDGSVARYRNEAGMSGQYIDWLMHSVSGLAIMLGIFLGALQVVGYVLVPFGIVTIICISLQLDRYSFAWWSICMYRQQNLVSGADDTYPGLDLKQNNAISLPHKFFKYLSLILFHEGYLIFWLPLLAGGNFFLELLGVPIVDFRVLLVIFGGTVFPIFIIFELVTMVKHKKLEKTYVKIFHSSDRPVFPDEHFFK